MSLIIKIENGLPVGNPIFLDNFRQAFPGADPLSNGYAEFIRVPKPKPVKYQVATGNHRYGWVGNAVADIWELREMTEEEKAEIDLWEKIQSETE